MAPRFTRTALLLLTFAMAACNATGATPIPTVTPVIATSAGPVSAPAALRGAWTANVQGTSASSGLWTLTISESNASLLNPVGGDRFSIGLIAITETTMTLAAAYDCEDQSEVTPGSYTLNLDGDTLTITLVSDSCHDRSGVVARAWTRQP
jgi:hypothetical protein